MDCAKRILLTGAGFTHNLGTPLAKGMWAEIFNNRIIQSMPRIKSLMLDDFDYESVYYRVMEGRFDPPEMSSMIQAISEAYEVIDIIIRSEPPHPLNILKLCELIDRFAENKRKSFIFTLNQDLFIERFQRLGKKTPSILGVGSVIDEEAIHFRKQVKQSLYNQIPKKEEIDDIVNKQMKNEKFFLVKLHGSQVWRSASNSQVIVIGRTKESDIKKEPILTKYFDIFKEVLLKPEQNLLIIGYGFGDEHINKILVHAINNSKLRLHIINPQSVDDLFENSFVKLGSSTREAIWGGLSGYYQCTLKQMFPPGRSGNTQFYRSLLNNYFGIKIKE